MGAVVHEQIPGIGNQHARKESAATDQIDQRETSPYLPKNREDCPIGVGMVSPMLSWREIVQHKTMNDVFGKGPRNDAAGEKRSGGGHSERRDREQDDCEQGSYQHFAKIDQGGH